MCASFNCDIILSCFSFFLYLKYDIYSYFKSRKCKRARSKQTDVTSCSSAVICNLPATCYDYNNIHKVRNNIFTGLYQFLNRYIYMIYSIYTIYDIINIITHYSTFEKIHVLICFCVTNLFL